jgi:hypothetical protein
MALDALRVVELGDTIPSAAAGAVFRRFGADVTKVRLPDMAPRATTQLARLRSILDREKTIVDASDVLDPAAIGLASAAAVMRRTCSTRPPLAWRRPRRSRSAT